jgi:hypothetical protein
MKRLLWVIAAVLAAGIALPVFSQEETETPAGGSGASSEEGGVIYKKKTIYDFEDDVISGDLTKPDGEYLESRKRARHQNLIKIREEFTKEVLNSVRGL